VRERIGTGVGEIGGMDDSFKAVPHDRSFFIITSHAAGHRFEEDQLSLRR
jgi:hypothetical protein